MRKEVAAGGTLHLFLDSDRILCIKGSVIKHGDQLGAEDTKQGHH